MIQAQFDFGSHCDVVSEMPSKKERNIAVGERIKALIKDSGKTQKWVAQKLGYKSPSTLSKHCAGENIPRGEELELMAVVLKTTTDYILSGKHKEPDQRQEIIFQQSPHEAKEDSEDMARIDKFIDGLQKQIDTLLDLTKTQSKTIADLSARTEALV